MEIQVSADGWLRWPGGGPGGGPKEVVRCALGRSGLVADKREGDGGTPIGRFPLRRVLYRPDRVPVPATALPVTMLTPADGWCDDPADPAYNQPVQLPFAASHERLWRDDHIYDLIVVLGHNDQPVIAGRGSAIFLHLTRDDHAPTAGCVALALADLSAVLAQAGPESVMVIG
ncbi:L,D-transpeptidase catalytic domain [uncultured Gammaproteobacteria bacterium]